MCPACRIQCHHKLNSLGLRLRQKWVCRRFTGECSADPFPWETATEAGVDRVRSRQPCSCLRTANVCAESFCFQYRHIWRSGFYREIKIKEDIGVEASCDRICRLLRRGRDNKKHSHLHVSAKERQCEDTTAGAASQEEGSHQQQRLP